MLDSHIKFVEAYTNQESSSYQNGAASAREAGFKPSNARNTASKLLKLPEIQNAIKERTGRTVDVKREKWWNDKVEFVNRIGEYLSGETLKSQINLKYYEMLARLQGWYESGIQITTISGMKMDVDSSNTAIMFAQKISKRIPSNELQKDSK